MKQFKALLKVNLQGMMHLFYGKSGIGRKKGNASSGKYMIVIMIVISLYISGIYSFMLGSVYGPMGMLDLMLAIMSVIVCLFALMMTAFGASGIVFGGKDMDLMLSLPIPAFQIMLSRVLALYLENLLLCAVMMLPCGVSYIVHGGKWSVYFIVALLVLTLFLAVIPTILALIVGYLLALLGGKFGTNALLNNLSYFVFFGVVMFFSFRVNMLMQSSVGEEGYHVFQKWLLPLWLFRGVLGNIGSCALFIAITALPFLLIIYVFSRSYQIILSRLQVKAARSDYRLSKLKSRGVFWALFRKELARYWGTPIYLFNTGIGIIIAVGGCVYGCIRRETLLSFVDLIGSAQMLVVICAIAGLLFAMTCPAAVSISLEGKNLWILKEAPVSAKTIFLAKGLLNAVLIWGTGIICTPMLAYAMQLSTIQLAAVLVFCIALGVFVPAGGLWLNLLFPKLDASNDVLVVKQSMSVMISMFGGMGIIVLFFVAYVLFGGYMTEITFVLGCSAIALAAGTIMVRMLLKTGEKRLLQL